MLKGLLIYDKVDIDKNKIYIDWMIKEGYKYNLDLKLYLIDDIDFNKLNLYRFAINRSRNSFITNKLENRNIRVFNRETFCILGNDKLKAYDFIDSLGISYLKVYRSLNDINKYKRIISKPKSGHGGYGIKILDDIKELDFDKNVYQEFIEDYIGDIRFYIIDNKITHSVIRKPKDKSIISNFTQGGDVEIFKLTKEHEAIIERILKNIDIDYGGIDFLLTKDYKILFNEFEDAVGSRMLSYLGINNTMDLFLSHVKQTLLK